MAETMEGPKDAQVPGLPAPTCSLQGPTANEQEKGRPQSHPCPHHGGTDDEYIRLPRSQAAEHRSHPGLSMKH